MMLIKFYSTVSNVLVFYVSGCDPAIHGEWNPLDANI